MINSGNTLIADCYHIQIMEGDLSRRLERCKDMIGHIQIASVPERAEPNLGEVNYQFIFEKLKGMGYSKPLGAEYRPKTTITEGLTWLSDMR